MPKLAVGAGSSRGAQGQTSQQSPRVWSVLKTEDSWNAGGSFGHLRGPASRLLAHVEDSSHPPLSAQSASAFGRGG